PGAGALAVARPQPGQVGAAVAERNGARLGSCELREWDVLVRVEVDAGPLPAMSARARAGPGPPEVPETRPSRPRARAPAEPPRRPRARACRAPPAPPRRRRRRAGP